MPMTERSRAALFRGLSEIIEDEEAVGEVLSSSIPQNIDELATKEFVRAEIHAATNRILIWNVGFNTTLAALVVTLVRLG